MVHAHHLTGLGYGAMGAKPPDHQTIPLCPDHHTGDNGIHQMGVRLWELYFGRQQDHLARTLELVRS